MDKDYESEHKQIWNYVSKDEANPSLAQEFECKTISTCEPIQEPLLTFILLVFTLFALASAGQ